MLLPYFLESKERYGQYFYNVNTTFYMWYDNWYEARTGTKAAGDREGWPDLPDDEIPSLSKYLSEHSLDQMRGRIRYGWRRYLADSCTDPASHRYFGYCIHLRLGAAIVVAGAFALAWHRRLRLSRREFQTGVFALLFVGIYALGALWYWPLAGSPRIIQAVLIPILWTFGVVIDAAWLKTQCAVIAGRRIKLVDLAYGALLILALCQVYEIAAFRAVNLYGG